MTEQPAPPVSRPIQRTSRPLPNDLKTTEERARAELQEVRDKILLLQTREAELNDVIEALVKVNRFLGA